MKYLIVYAHPNPKSFCHAVRERVEEELKKHGHTFVTRDLYDMNFTPALTGTDFMKFKEGKASADIHLEQDHIRSADRILLIHPVWWFNMPAILKGYIDRVFSYGFAYSMNGHIPQGLLKGKEAIILSTTGGPGLAYELLGYKWALKTAIDDGIFKFCGIKVLKHKYFYAVPAISDAARKAMLESISSVVCI